ncbi:MAG: S-adenosylmethionine:tRNA ribosyltransferase-isomerase [Symbiopectobacterium sp.]
MAQRHDTLLELHFDDTRDVLIILNDIGHMPLPPYIDRPDEDADRKLYQTVYNQRPWRLPPRRWPTFCRAHVGCIARKRVEMAFLPCTSA